jgi:Tol biopolymer transport system component
MKRRVRRTASGAVWAAVLAGPLLGQSTHRVSVDSFGVEGNGDSGLNAFGAVKISADGRVVAFVSLATNLVSGDTNGFIDVFVHDWTQGVTERVNVGPTGEQANDLSGMPALSSDGRFVAYYSYATNLVPGDTNGEADVFVRDRLLSTTECVSVSPTGVVGNLLSHSPSISGDGRYVAFGSAASNLIVGDSGGYFDVFVRDRLTGTTERVSVGTGGVPGIGHSVRTALSADGRFVAFTSNAHNLVAGDTNNDEDVFVHDRLTGTTERVNLGPGGVEAVGGDCCMYVPLGISGDGRYVVFESPATNLVAADGNGRVDVFLRDRQTGVTERMSISDGGVEGEWGGNQASISSDGRFVAFGSASSNLVPGDTNGTLDIFVRDLVAGTIEIASRASDETLGNGFSARCALSADGRFLAFSSSASNLVGTDSNGVSDVFVRDRQRSIQSFCAGDGIDTGHTTPCPCANFGAPGNGCASSVEAGGASLGATGYTLADDVRLEGSAMPATSSCIYLQGDALDDVPFGDGVRCAGGGLVRLRTRFNVAGASAFPDSTDTVTLSQRGGVVPWSGVRRYYQTYYRNAAPAFCPPATFNVTNGVVVDW